MRLEQTSNHKRNQVTAFRGFTLIEVLIGAVILSIVTLGIYQAYAAVIKTVRAGRIRTDASLLANEQIEVIRNIPYEDVGIVSGVPAGVIPREQTLIRGGFAFQVTASVRNIDDPFDGQLGSTTHNDLSPADYKLVQVDVVCPACQPEDFTSLEAVTTVSPRSLETSTGNGALIVRVFNANGDPVQGARVRIENPSSSPAILIDEVTNANGLFELIDTPPGSLAYQLRISKDGYSADGTAVPSAANPNPANPPKTVAAGQVSAASFSIDLLSQLKIKVVNRACVPLAGTSFRLQGQKKIGQDPYVYKYDETLVTNASGQAEISNLEWDTYKMIFTTTGSRMLAGSSLLLPLSVVPNSNQEINLVTVPSLAKGLLVTVRDASTGLPLSDSTVTVGGSSLVTNQGFVTQTDWTGGPGQAAYSIPDMFAETDGNVDFSVGGELRLRFSLGQYVSSGELISSIYDTEGTTTNYASVRWQPADQATSTGVESVRLQIASGNDPATTTWNYLGPDGTPNSFYAVSDSAISSVHDGDRYFRYKIYLQTADNSVTPNISDVSLSYATACTPPGQAYFDGLSGELQPVSVSRSGYAVYTGTVVTNDAWQAVNVLLEKE